MPFCIENPPESIVIMARPFYRVRFPSGLQNVRRPTINKTRARSSVPRVSFLLVVPAVAFPDRRYRHGSWKPHYCFGVAVGGDGPNVRRVPLMSKDVITIIIIIRAMATTTTLFCFWRARAAWYPEIRFRLYLSTYARFLFPRHKRNEFGKINFPLFTGRRVTAVARALSTPPSDRQRGVVLRIVRGPN